MNFHLLLLRNNAEQCLDHGLVDFKQSLNTSLSEKSKWMFHWIQGANCCQKDFNTTEAMALLHFQPNRMCNVSVVQFPPKGSSLQLWILIFQAEVIWYWRKSDLNQQISKLLLTGIWFLKTFSFLEITHCSQMKEIITEQSIFPIIS